MERVYKNISIQYERRDALITASGPTRGRRGKKRRRNSGLTENLSEYNFRIPFSFQGSIGKR